LYNLSLPINTIPVDWLIDWLFNIKSAIFQLNFLDESKFSNNTSHTDKRWWWDGLGFMVLNATCNNITVIPWVVSFISGGNRSRMVLCKDMLIATWKREKMDWIKKLILTPTTTTPNKKACKELLHIVFYMPAQLFQGT
jgi:hypothetical protein